MNFLSLQTILIGKEFTGIEHYTINGEEWSAFLILKKRENELQITYNDKQIYSDSISKRIDRKSLTCLIINTNQVLIKEIGESNLTDEKAIHKAFPNLSITNFFFEIWRLKNKTIIAVTRKAYIETIIKKYQEQGFTISSISLGVCSISEITGFISADSINTNFQKISLSDEEMLISNEEIKQNSYYKINGLTVQSSYLLAFTGILQFLIKSNHTKGNIVSYNQVLLNNFIQNTFFKKGLQTALGILLTLLLVNFFVFSHYYSKNSEVDELSSLNSASSEKLSVLRKRIAEKEKLANSILNITDNSYSAKINLITKSTPNSILLTGLTLNPLEKNIKEYEKISAEQNTIIITGITKDNNEFTKWIEKLTKTKFINNVVIKQFGKNELLETTFTLKLKLNQ